MPVHHIVKLLVILVALSAGGAQAGAGDYGVSSPRAPQPAPATSQTTPPGR